MADDLATIEAALKAAHPTLTAHVNGADVTLDAVAYEARIEEMALAERQAQLDAETAEALKTLRRQVRIALTALDADIDTLTTNPGSVTLATLRGMVLRTDRVLVGLIRVLIDLDLIERDG